MSFDGKYGDSSFFKHHFGPWMGHRDTKSVSWSDHHFVHQGETKRVVFRYLTYYMRSFKCTAVYATENATQVEARQTSTSSHRGDPQSGVRFEREALSVEDVAGRRISLIEHRYSTHLTMTPLGAPVGNFLLFSVTDTLEKQDYYHGHPIRQFHWENRDIHPAGLLTGIAAFQAQMSQVIAVWADDWDKTLYQLSAVSSATASQLKQPIKIFTNLINVANVY